METSSPLLALCEEHQWAVDLIHQGLIMRALCCFLIRLNKLLNKHPSCQWFKKPSRSDVTVKTDYTMSSKNLLSSVSFRGLHVWKLERLPFNPYWKQIILGLTHNNIPPCVWLITDFRVSYFQKLRDGRPEASSLSPFHNLNPSIASGRQAFWIKTGF